MANISPITAAFLRQALRDSGRSINSVAKGAGVPQPVLHRFYKGQQGLTFETATKLKKELGLLPRDGRDHDEEVLVNLIAGVEEERWWLEQHLPALGESDSKLLRLLQQYRKRHLEPALAALRDLLDRHYPVAELAEAGTKDGA
jgi:hypothetical protein